MCSISPSHSFRGLVHSRLSSSLWARGEAEHCGRRAKKDCAPQGGRKAEDFKTLRLFILKVGSPGPRHKILQRKPKLIKQLLWSYGLWLGNQETKAQRGDGPERRGGCRAKSLLRLEARPAGPARPSTSTASPTEGLSRSGVPGLGKRPSEQACGLAAEQTSLS